MIPATLVVEDDLSERVLRRLARARFDPGPVYGHRGVGYISKNLAGFNNAARGGPWLVLADLDQHGCAPELINQWLPHGPHPNLVLRIAVREVEAWLLADRRGFARFAGIRTGEVPEWPEDLEDPKRALIALVERSRRSALKADILPPHPGGAQGPGYNGRLGSFVEAGWDPGAARPGAPSLDRAMRALAAFTWP